MSKVEHHSKIVVELDASKAEAGIQTLLDGLTEAHRLASRLGAGPGAWGKGPTAPAGSTTPSTAGNAATPAQPAAPSAARKKKDPRDQFHPDAGDARKRAPGPGGETVKGRLTSAAIMTPHQMISYAGMASPSVIPSAAAHMARGAGQIGSDILRLKGASEAVSLLPLGIGAAVGAGLGLGAVSLGIRMKGFEQRAALENMQQRSRYAQAGIGKDGVYSLQGSHDKYRWGGMGDKYGMSPNQMLSLEDEYTAAAGAPRSMSKGVMNALVQARMRGVNTGSLGSFAATMALGGGGTGFSSPVSGLRGLVGSAEQMGFRGNRTDEHINRIVAATRDLAEKGYQLNVKAAASYSRGLSQTGEYALQGMGGTRAALRMQQMGPNAAADLGQSMGGGLAQSALLAWSMRQGGGPMAVMERLGNLSQDKSGSATAGAIKSVLPNEMAQMFALTGAGESVSAARGILRGKDADISNMRDLDSDRVSGARTVNRAVARREEKILGRVNKDPTQVDSLIGIVSGIENMLLHLSDPGGSLDSVVRKLDAILQVFKP